MRLAISGDGSAKTNAKSMGATVQQCNLLQKFQLFGHLFVILELSCHIPDNKRLPCPFNQVLPGGPWAWRARSNSDSFETSPGSVPVPWTKTPNASRDLRELRRYPH